MPTLRPCKETGCPELGYTTRCPKHTREHDAARGRRQERGYDAAHERLRADYQRRMDEDGERFTCWRPGCGKRIDPTDWHLGHDDRDRSRYRGPECPSCNQATASRR